jgi:hypothetical protein
MNNGIKYGVKYGGDEGADFVGQKRDVRKGCSSRPVWFNTYR